ncbi:MAG: bifunctional NAD(P)H-hydrate repair enzyme [Acidimicrobiia bacterium]|nr:MAG: bifunctional NAD(P)H-hydrate repair enzyme [Acidimicrobiia bacterium]
MRPVLTPAEMAEADRRAIEGGTAFEVLVERAGRAVAAHARRILGGAYGRRVVVLCGRGNNGADGHVAARLLRAAGVGVDVFDALDAVDGIDRAVSRADLAIDAMFGTGFRGALEGGAARAADAVAALPTLAVDIPSGVDGATGEVRGGAVRATETVCFAALKPGLLFEPGRSHAGRVHVVDIGIDVTFASGSGAPRLGVAERADLWLPRRDATDHKWSHALFVVGGSVGMVGAPMMVAHAAARCGAGMVVAGLPGVETARLASGSEVVVRALPATPEGSLDEDAARVVLKDAHRFHALSVGPGLGRDDRAHAAARRLVAEAPIPVVVDADALNALAVDAAALRVRAAAGLPPAVLTPHAGEYERLAGRPVGGDRVEAARHLARATGAVVCLKGPGTVVAAPDGRAAVNRTDGPALATAGSGDVLTGIVGGLLANGADPFTAAVTGAHLQGRAARTAGTGDALVAIDLIEALPRTLDALRTGSDPWED